MPTRPMRRSTWTPEEDAKLSKLVLTRGAAQWSSIAEDLGGNPLRNGKSCRLRWHNQLDPCLKKEPFSSAEEYIIVSKQAEYGNSWAAISRHLPGRTDNAIKNHWNGHLRRCCAPLACASSPATQDASSRGDAVRGGQTRPEALPSTPHNAEARSHRTLASSSSTAGVHSLPIASDRPIAACANHPASLVPYPVLPWDSQRDASRGHPSTTLDEIAIAAEILGGQQSKRRETSDLWREGSRAACLAAENATPLRSSRRRVRLTARAASAQQAVWPEEAEGADGDSLSPKRQKFMPMCERNQLSSGNRVRFSANAANLSSELSEHARRKTTAAHSPDGWNAAVSTVRAADRDDACAKVSICPSAALTRDPRARQLHSRKASGSCRPPAEPDDNGQTDRQQVEAPVKSKAPCSEAPLRSKSSGLSMTMEAAGDGNSSSPSTCTQAVAMQCDTTYNDCQSAERLCILAEASVEQYFASDANKLGGKEGPLPPPKQQQKSIPWWQGSMTNSAALGWGPHPSDRWQGGDRRHPVDHCERGTQAVTEEAHVADANAESGALSADRQMDRAMTHVEACAFAQGWQQALAAVARLAASSTSDLLAAVPLPPQLHISSNISHIQS